MKHIYIKDADGRKVIVEATDEVAQAYRESLREEWRGDAKERYHTISLGAVADAGHEFADGDEGIEERLSREEDDKARRVLLEKLRKAVEHLTPLQRATLYKLYVLHYLFFCLAYAGKEEQVCICAEKSAESVIEDKGDVLVLVFDRSVDSEYRRQNRLYFVRVFHLAPHAILLIPPPKLCTVTLPNSLHQSSSLFQT